MIRWIKATVTLILLFPVMANAASWTFNTWVKSAGGTINSRNMANQTSTAGSVFSNYTTHAPLTATVTANTGYNISNITVNGISTSNPSSPYIATVQGMSQQSVYATFVAKLLNIAASAGYGGSVTPTKLSNVYYGQKPSSPVKFNFTPISKYNVVGISGVPAGATVSSALPALPNTTVSVTFPTTFTFTNDIALVGTFAGPPVAVTGPPQVVLPGTLVTLDGSSSTGSITSWNWTQTSGPGYPNAKVIADNTPGKTVSFTPTALGSYYFNLTVTGGSVATTNVVVSNDPAATARNQCQNCHQGNGIGIKTNVFGNWSSSRHAADLIMCSNCHVGANSGGHPGSLSAGTVDAATFKVIFPTNGLATGANFCVACHKSSIVDAFNSSPHNSNNVICTSCHVNGAHNPDVSVTVCNGCHVDSNGNVSRHPLAIGSSPCVACHDPHSTAGSAPNITAAHFNNITSAGYPASYVTSRATCEDCHYYSSANLTIRKEWAQSSHAATTDDSWKIYDFKIMSGCVQCHTTTGFKAYSTGRMTAAWGTGSDKTKEVLTCVGCHSDITTGTVRTVAPVRPYANDTTYTNPDSGMSNICMDCHSGTKSGKSIAAMLDNSADFTNLPFVAPHYTAAGGVIFGQVGYHFPGRTYNAESTHTKLGSPDGSGSCVNCHKNSTYGHTFKTGALSLCTSCHGTSLNDTAISADKTGFLNALEVLRAQLAVNGFVYMPNPPYFTNTNWGAKQTGADTMGAAFNYVLFATEPGAYAHNPTYAQQLILDSIDYLDNGQIDNSVSTLAIPNLLGNQAISQTVADSVTAYKAKNACTICHGGTAATVSPIATNAHGAHLTAYYGPGSYLGTDIGSCQACHVYSSATHMNGIVDLVTGSGSACANCHPGTLPVWSSGVRLNCTDCHAPVPSVLPNGVAAPYKANFALKGHGQYPASNQCTSCHDANSRHISGSLGSYTRLTLLDDNNLCASCHNNAVIVRPSFLNMSTHFTAKGGGQTMLCNVCHDPHGTTNLSMIRTTINGMTITYTDSSTGFVNTTTNLGLCQVCHTLTAHYRAGVPETNHPTINCLGCHRHNAAGGAFRPNGSCDACHGYPPAPRRNPMTVTFGTMNNWSSARFDDYSGGGGAHLTAGHVPKTARPSDGWANCLSCHNGGAASHTMTLPIKDHVNNVNVQVAPQYSFTPGTAPVFDTTARTCSNVSCHSVKAGTFSYYFPGGDGDPELNTVTYGGAQQTPSWNSTGNLCSACHGNPPADGSNGSNVWHSGYHADQGPTGTANQCQFCHPDATGSGGQGTSITNTTQHRNGAVDLRVTFKSSCFGCH